MTRSARRRGRARRPLVIIALVAVCLVASSCLYFPAAQRHIAATGTVPWWCRGTPDLTAAECRTFSVQMDLARAYALRYPALADFTATGATEIASRPDGIGAPFGTVSSTFNGARPNVLLYDGTAPTSRLVGFAWAIDSVGPPDGFPGPRDGWNPVNGGTGTGIPSSETWWLPAWLVRGYLNHPDVFAPSHPCLESGVTLTSTTDACFTQSHTVPLRVLVTNDDGIGAPGIDALVAGLQTVSGISIDVVAPATNQSGSGDNYTPGGVTSSPGTTASGFPGRAVNGFPADSVLHALNALGRTPDLVMSGINEGQNLTNIGDILSGTVGAARTGSRNLVPSVAASQGVVTGLEPDFPTGVAAVLDWLEDFRLGLAGPPFMEVANINIPTCAPGSSVRGTVDTVVAPSVGPGQSYFVQDCTSTETVIDDDLDAFNHGFVGIADMGRFSPPS